MSEPTETNEASTPTSVGGSQPAASRCTEAAAEHGNCEDALRDLYGYLDGEITQDRRERIQHHIDECGPCLDAFDFEAELRQLVARTCTTEAPSSLRDRVAQAILDCEDGPDDTMPG